LAYLTQTSGPATTPISLAEAKSHLRVEIPDEDSLISAYVSAATSWVEQYLRRALISQTWRIYLDEFPGDGEAIVVPLSPLVSISAFEFKTYDTGEWKEVHNSTYTVEVPGGENPGRGRILPAYGATWGEARGEPNSVRYTAEVGYGASGSAVPEPIRTAIRQLVGTAYANRESVVTGTIATKIPQTVEFLLSPYRLFEFK
jgi:uncharacterized phiE125 gp8 family phage protein